MADSLVTAWEKIERLQTKASDLEAENAALREQLAAAQNACLEYDRKLHEAHLALDAAQKDAERNIEAAWRDGYRSLITYNDLEVSDEDTCWRESTTFSTIAKEKAE